MKAKPFIAAFLAVIAVLAAVSFYLSTTVERADKSVSTLVSPDGKFKAVKVTFTGHAAAPFCVVSISVMLAAYPDELAQLRKEYEVFSGPCGKFADGAASPRIEWLASTALQTTYAATAKEQALKMPRLRNTDVTKTVHVTSVMRE